MRCPGRSGLQAPRRAAPRRAAAPPRGGGALQRGAHRSRAIAEGVQPFTHTHTHTPGEKRPTPPGPASNPAPAPLLHAGQAARARRRGGGLPGPVGQHARVRGPPRGGTRRGGLPSGPSAGRRQRPRGRGVSARTAAGRRGRKAPPPQEAESAWGSGRPRPRAGCFRRAWVLLDGALLPGSCHRGAPCFCGEKTLYLAGAAPLGSSSALPHTRYLRALHPALPACSCAHGCARGAYSFNRHRSTSLMGCAPPVSSSCRCYEALLPLAARVRNPKQPGGCFSGCLTAQHPGAMQEAPPSPRQIDFCKCGTRHKSLPDATRAGIWASSDARSPQKFTLGTCTRGTFGKQASSQLRPCPISTAHTPGSHLDVGRTCCTKPSGHRARRGCGTRMGCRCLKHTFVRTGRWLEQTCV
jgi:hypothetical protein